MDSIKNSNTVQSLSNGPMADKARNEAAATKSEFSNLASARQTPQTTTASGQNLTHYHSFFYNLLSWENPRATAISYAAVVAFIVATRYLPVAHYALRFTWIALGTTAAAEIVGKVQPDLSVRVFQASDFGPDIGAPSQASLHLPPTSPGFHHSDHTPI